MFSIKDGDYTSTIYGMIRDDRYADALRILQYELQKYPDSRAALSLIAYCYYNLQDYTIAADYYSKLANRFPYQSEYKLYYAQSLYNAFLYPEAVRVLSQSNDSSIKNQVIKLNAAIKYHEGDLYNARILVEQLEPDDPNVKINLEGKYLESLKKFINVTSSCGFKPNLSYSLALCHYELGDYSKALKYIAEIIDRGIKDHPELGVGMITEGIDIRFVGNSQILHETALIEAYTLKFAIEYKLKNFDAANEALTDMPPRLEEDLDPVTLHNQALISFETNLADSLSKLQYLLCQNPFPREAFTNLLLLYCKYEYFDLLADILAENAHLAYKYLSQFNYDYFDAIITQLSSPTDAFKKFDILANNKLSVLLKAHQTMLKAREIETDKKVLEKTNDEFELILESYLTILMAQTKILWDQKKYEQVEKILRNSAEFCKDNEIWTLNLAHTLFMQEKYKESADWYAPLVSKNFEKMLKISAIVLANLCVCYIMTNCNEEAEEIMKKVEKEENKLTEKKSFHLSIINLVIGTLYCSKDNYEFGISRIVRALEPCEKKLGIDTWYYSKRCMISMLENLAKCVITISDDVLDECLKFLELCELYGQNINTEVSTTVTENIKNINKTIAYEARILKALLLEIIE